MKLTKTASGKTTVKISKKEWQRIGRKAGWIKQSEMSFEELQNAWENSDEDIKVNVQGDAYYAGKLIVPRANGQNPNWKGIAAWMQENSYWPNVWEQNDHGNVSLYSVDEYGNATYHGGLV